MRANRGLIVLMSWAALTLLPVAARAQAQAVDLPIRVGQKVRITTDAGVKVQGRVLAMAPDSVEIGEGGRRSSLAATSVRRIQVNDSVENGVAIGLITFGFLGVLADEATSTDIFTGTPIRSNFRVPGIAIGAVGGALLGWVIDAARMKTVYRQADQDKSVAVRPIVSAAGNGVGVQVRW